jgi:putative nucleotidyltransferase with HDIG domain
MDVNKQILLVGTEPGLAPGSPTLSSPLKDQWTFSCVGNGTQAVELLEKTRFQAVVSELRLPDMSGIQLLDQVIQRTPSAHRFILADLTDRQTMLKCVGTAHQFLSKPCDSTKLEAALDRAFRMEVLFGNEVVKQMVTQMRKVPSPPAIYFQIVKELQSPAASMENIGAIISQDMAVTGKLLQMVNSAAFGLQRPVSSPAEAVMYLGIETTKSLVLLAHTYSHFDRIPPSIFSVDGLWRHSLAAGRLARAIARAERSGEEVVDQSFTAGLLHDMGKLVLAANQPEAYGRVNTEARRSQVALWEAEFKAFGATHAEVGAWLAAVWGLPIQIIEALALHHHPSRFLSEGFSPLSAVHAGNALEHEVQADGTEPGVARLDLEYLGNQGWTERIEAWRELGRNFAPRSNSGTDTERRMAA